MKDKKTLYYARAAKNRKRHGGIWTPKNENGVGCWLSLEWHKIEISEQFAESLKSAHHIEIHSVDEFDAPEGFKEESVVSHSATVWSVPNNSLRRTASDRVFHDEEKSLEDSGVKPKTKPDSSTDDDDDEEVPDSVSKILGDQPEGRGGSSSSRASGSKKGK